MQAASLCKQQLACASIGFCKSVPGTREWHGTTAQWHKGNFDDGTCAIQVVPSGHFLARLYISQLVFVLEILISQDKNLKFSPAARVPNFKASLKYIQLC